MKIFKIKDKIITEQSNPFIIAEIGCNHCGDMSLCIDMILKAKKCGADAIKLQARDNDRLFTKELLNKPYENENSYGLTYGEHRRFLDFMKFEEFITIKDYCRDLGLIFIITPFEENSLELVKKIDPDGIKVASCDLNNIPLLNLVAETKKPTIISTGGSYHADIYRAVRQFESKNDNLAILHCVSTYPNMDEELNLTKIKSLDRAFSNIIGFSCHHPGLLPNYIAYLLGARIFEVHFTLNRAFKGTDHAFSLEPEGLSHLCQDLKRIPTMIGERVNLSPSDRELKGFIKKFGKSWYAKNDIAKGSTFSINDLELRAPAIGLLPNEINLIISEIAHKDFKKGDLVCLNKT